MNNRIRIPNDDCTPEIDFWLRENVGHKNLTEHFAINAQPFRSFSFTYPKDATMFALKFR